MDLKIKIPKIKKGFKKGSSVINPNLYWNFILAIALLMTILAFVLGLWLFRKINKDVTLSEDVSSGQVETIKKTRIDGALKYFSEKANKSSEITNSPSPLIDPSL